MRKKIAFSICIILIIALLGTLLTACDDKNDNTEPEPDFRMAVMSDTHILAESQMGDTRTVSLAAQEAKGQKMLILSEGLFKEGIDKVIADKQEVLLIAGDLTDDGARLSHETVASCLKKAEDNGVKVFVIPGNHDINNKSHTYATDIAQNTPNINGEEFAEIYKDFGYDEALDRDENTLSYTADLGKGYRLLGIDASYYTPNPDGSVTERNNSILSDDTILWIEQSLISAQNDGQKVIAMIHFPTTPHLSTFIDGTNACTDQVERIQALFLQYGVKFVFSGHLHGSDIAEVKGEDASTSYVDIETASLSNYPMPIRYFEGFEGADRVRTVYLTSIKNQYIPDIFTPEEKAEITTDLVAYAEKTVSNGMINKILNKLDKDRVIAMLGAFGLDKTATETDVLAENIRTLIRDFFNTPLYSSGRGDSLEEVCAEYDITLPESNYKTIWEVATRFLLANYKGNEGYTMDDAESELLQYGIYYAFYAIDQFDFFGRMHALNKDVPAIDLSGSMELLFTEGLLDIKDNNILSVLGSVKAIERFQERWSKKAGIGPMIASLDFSDGDDLLEKAGGIIDFITGPSFNLSALLGEDSTIGEIIKDIPIRDILNCDEGYIDLGWIYSLLYEDLGNNIITDVAPDDETVIIKYNS